MNNLHLLDIPAILTKFTASYMNFFGHSHADQINCGECFVWAWGVYNFLKDRGIPSDLVSCISHGGHAWVEIDGVAYDSEHLNGTTTKSLLKEFVDGCWGKPEFYYQDEEEFYYHWRNNGRRCDMLGDKEVLAKMKRSLGQISRRNQKVA